MTDLHEVFSGAAEPGLHRLEPAVTGEDLAEMAAGHGWRPLVVDLTGIVDKAGLLDRIAEGASFPGHIGRNWDALQDALRDLSWHGPADGYLVVLDGWDGFVTADPGDAEVLEAVVVTAAAEWLARGTPMVAVTL